MIYISNLNVPNLKVIFLREFDYFIKTNKFYPITVIILQIWRHTLSMLVFTSISTSYLTSGKPNLSWTTQLSTFSADSLRFEISQMS